MKGITKETFQKMAADSKLDVLFDLTSDICTDVKGLKNRKFFHNGLSLVGGILGGIVAVVGKTIFWK